MTTMKRAISWITALAMILMLCTCTVIAQASDTVQVMYSDSNNNPQYSRSFPNGSFTNPLTRGTWYLIPSDEFSLDDTSDAMSGKSLLTRVATFNSVSYYYKDSSNTLTCYHNLPNILITLPTGLPAAEYTLYCTQNTSVWEFTVYNRFNSGLATVDAVEDVIYGSNEAPTITLTYKKGTEQEAALVQGTDFTLTYAVDDTVEGNTAVYSAGSGIPTLPGSYVATISAAGLYHDDDQGEPITVKFDILPKDISTAIDVDVDIKYFDDTYTGSAIEPEVSVYDGQTRLIKGVDYTLTYTNNIAAGNYTAAVNVNGIGNYTGTKVLNFSIVKPTVVHESYPTYVAAVAVPNSPTLKTGDNNNDVATLQTRLNELGYNCGEVDGVFGAKTRAAVIAFQKANNLSVDGVVGPQTWAALGTGSYVYYTPVASVSVSAAAAVSHPTLRRGSTGDAVKALQSALNALGYNCGEVDGVFGAKTEAGVRAYQTAMGLQADGVVGPLTWAKLG